MNVTVIPIPILKDNYVWTIIDSQKKSAIVIDPGDAAPIIDFLVHHQLALQHIFITHHHWDHTNGLTDLWHAFPNASVFGFANSSVSGLTHLVREGFQITTDYFNAYHIIEIPGHTLDHIAYYSPRLLFCGDTLFAAGCGRLFEGTAEQLHTSLQKIAALPEDTNVYCAHEYTLNNLQFAKIIEPHNQNIQKRIEHVLQLRSKNLPSLPSTLKEEKETNPFLRCHVAEVMNCVSDYVGHALHNSLDVFRELREWKNNF